MKILVTGAAGFIGYHLTKALLARGDEVTGIDNLNDYYDVNLKLARLKSLGLNPAQLQSQPTADIKYNLVGRTLVGQNPEATTKIAERISARHHSEPDPTTQLTFHQLNLIDRDAIANVFATDNFDVVVNLAAQAGVRHSIENPNVYVDSNLIGFVNILEGCRHNKISHLVYASSSSVYGMNSHQPFSTGDRVDHPISLYAATKKSGELMAHTYSHLFNLPTTGLRFFTVYGPWGRPDMAYFKFTKAILEGNPIDVFNEGNMQRDFTYIDDVVNGVLKAIDKIPSPQTCKDTNARAPYKIYNIGNNKPVTLRRFISSIETACGVKAKENHLPMQPGDVPITYADIDEFTAATGFKPTTSIEQGIKQFVDWYKSCYQ